MEKPRAVAEHSTPAPYEPIPKWRARQEGTRWCKVSLGEWDELQAKRRQVLAKGAGLVSLQFLADQVMTTSQSLVMFAGLAARIVWLRKQRRRRGKVALRTGVASAGGRGRLGLFFPGEQARQVSTLQQAARSF